MALRVQIVRMEKNETRWSFVAHGAAYTKSEAAEVVATAKERGAKIKLLLVKGD